MSGYTWADPEVFDMSGATGSHVFNAASIAPPWTYHSGANVSTTYFPVTAAIDGDPATAWENDFNPTTTPTWYAIRATSSAPITLTSYTIVPRTGWVGRSPRDWHVDGSNDGSTWTTVDTQSVSLMGENGATFTLATPATYNIFRIYVTALFSGSILNIGEFYLNGVPNPYLAGATYYIKLTNLIEDAIYQPTVTNGTGVLADAYAAWKAYVTDPPYPQSSSEYVGQFERGNPSLSRIHADGQDLLLTVQLSTAGTFTWAWTSTDLENRNYGWYGNDPIELTLSSEPQLYSYDDLNGDLSWPDSRYMGERHYVMHPTTADPITFSTDEPDGYHELYRETGVWAWDDYIEDGYNLPDGTPDPDGGILSIVPIPGEEYHLVIFPNGSPDYDSQYTLTVDQTALAPPPYVVANDQVANATDLGLLTDGMTHGYDNTGATTDVITSWAKRNIWYRFHVDTPTSVRIRLTPSDATPEKDPYQYLYAGLPGNDPNQYAGGPPSGLYTNLVPGTEYYLMLNFQEVVPTSAWEQGGLMTISTKPTPVYMLTPPPTLAPGDASPGGGQNYAIERIWPEHPYVYGDVQIVAPSDGGLSIIIEASSEGGTVYRPSVTIEIPYGYQEYVSGLGTYQTVPFKYQTDGYHPVGVPNSPRDLPWRAVGASTPQPITFRVKAGDVFKVKIYSSVSGCFIRWGMATTGTPSEWFSARYGEVLTIGGTYVPYGISAADADTIRQRVSAWPESYTGTLFADKHMPGETEVTNPPVVGYYGNFVGNNPGQNSDAGGIRTNLAYPALQDDLDGLNGGRTTETMYTEIVRSDIKLSFLHDPGKNWTRQEVVTGMRMIRHEAWVYGNSVDQWNAGSYSSNGMVYTDLRLRDPLDYRMQKFLEANAAVVQWAGNRKLDAYRSVDLTYVAYPGGSPYYGSFDTNYEMLQWHIEWANEPTDEPAPVWNVYRWTGATNISRYVRAPYDPLDGYAGTPIISPALLAVRLYSVPSELTDQPWVTPAEVTDVGEVIEQTDYPAEALTGFANRATIQPKLETNSSTPHPKNLPWDDDGVQANVFGGSYPQNVLAFKQTYAMMIGPYEDRSVDFDGILATAWTDHGMGAPHYFTHSMGSGYQTEMSIFTQINRYYPTEFRVAKFIPNLEPIEVPVEPFPNEFIASQDAGDYAYLGDVGVGCAPPKLWFLYKKWGFLGMHVVAYGQGLGNTQSARHGVLKMGEGWPTFPTAGDIVPTVTSWTLNAATDHAYDGTGVVFPGTDLSPPVVDVEVQTIEFIIPNSILLDGPEVWHVYVTNDCGMSNALELLLYPLVDMNMQGADPDNVSYSAAISGRWSLADTESLTQHYSIFSNDPPGASTFSVGDEPRIIIAGRFPERAPLYLTNAVTQSDFTGGELTTGLDDPVAVTIPLERRYRPLDSKVEPRPDLGTGWSAWNSNETSTQDWAFHVSTAPYVDDTNLISSRLGELNRPAMVFPGNAWAQTTAGFAAGPVFTVFFVMTIHPDPITRSYVMSSFIQGAPDPDAFPMEIYVEGDVLTMRVGGKLATYTIAPGYIGNRPIMIGISINETSSNLLVASATPLVRNISHAKIGWGSKLYLGRSNDASNLRMATFDVLDCCIDNRFRTSTQLWTVMNRFDSVYGVLK